MNGSERPAASIPVGAPPAIEKPSSSGAVPDAVALLARHPELLANKSAVLDLAYEEYCGRAKAGSVPEPEAFCERFPAYRSSLRRLLAAHQFLALNSDLLGTAPPVRWPEPGEQWCGFHLARDLGRGAFARVYLATEPAAGGRAVALKLSLEGGGEAQTLGRLDHRNVVRIYYTFVDKTSGLTAVCMPFLGAATLTDVLDFAFPKPESAPPRQARVFLDAVHAASLPNDPKPPLATPDRRLEQGSFEEGVALVGLELSEALEFLHKQQVYHLDLKPSNVLLNSGGHPLLLDFNLSADTRNAVSRPGGTLPYASPEQVRALIADKPMAAPADGRADLFSLGVILYELLTGVPPFGRLPLIAPRELAPLLLGLQRSGCQPIRAVNPKINRKLAALVERCLAFDPAWRPASAVEVAVGLKGFLARSQRARRMRRAALPLLCGIVLLAGLVVALWPTDPRKLGRAAFQAGDYAAAEQHFGRALVNNPKDSQARWSLALSRLKLSEDANLEQARPHMTLALENLLQVSGEIHRAEALACIGYCLSRCGRHDEALFHYRQAEDSGFHKASLYNNRAFSHLGQSNLDAAQDDLVLALKYDANLLAAYHNRAFLANLRWQRDHDTRVASSGLEAAITAITKGLHSAELYCDAAHLAIAVGKNDQALDFLKSAVEYGKPPNLIVGDVRFSASLNKDPRFRDLLKQKLTANPSRAGSPRVVLPVQDLLD
jgi:eukaryotic-like serine/threonine-protein kinase